ncbi:hypothetical protein GF345_05980 [Candidatus Woesearchaeota archaeon]|nr:hypothetical protein [Candidatus Woesearchaeota archaeon]
MENPFAKKEDSGKDKEEPKKHSFGGSLFGKHEADVPVTAMSDLSNQINNLSRRLRILEERYTNLRKNTQLTDQNLLKFNKDFHREASSLNSDLTDARREFSDLKDKVRLIVKELMECAKTEEVKILEKYINMWDPVKFVQRNEVDRIVEEKINEVLSQKSKDLKE